MRNRLLAAGIAAAALAYPVTALAQSAGDNQYTDPLAGKHATPPAHTSTSTGSSPSTSSAPSTAPAQSSAAGTSTSSTASPQASGAQSSSVPLANTGFDAWIPALAGVMLIGGSVALRRSARRRA